MTRSISYSVTYNYNLSYKHRYAAFVKHVRSRFLFVFFFFYLGSAKAPVVSILNEILRGEVSQELKLRHHAANQGMSNCVQKRMGNYSVRMYEEKIWSNEFINNLPNLKKERKREESVLFFTIVLNCL